MNGIVISSQTAGAMLTQMVRGGKAEINLLLGDMASMPLSPVDEMTMRRRVEEALGGLHCDVTASCTRHLANMRSCSVDVALLRHIGLDPSVVAYVVATMGALDVTIDRRQIHFSSGPARLHFDLPAGDAVWTAAQDHSLYVGNLPATVVTALQGRVAQGQAMLSDVIRHPVLDAHPLMMRQVRVLGSGGTIIEIMDHPAITETPLDQLLNDHVRTGRTGDDVT